MSEHIPTQYEQELTTLEQRVEELLVLCHELKNENQFLRHQQTELLTERAVLVEKNELARSRIESMIMRLRSLEQNYGQ